MNDRYFHNPFLIALVHKSGQQMSGGQSDMYTNMHGDMFRLNENKCGLNHYLIHINLEWREIPQHQMCSMVYCWGGGGWMLMVSRL